MPRFTTRKKGLSCHTVTQYVIQATGTVQV